VSDSLNEDEFRSALNLDAADRYEYFIRRVAGWGETWTLQGRGGVVSAEDQDGSMLVPLWPHELYAERCAVRDWADARPQKILLGDLLDTWVPRMERQHIKLAVFPLRDGPCAQVDAADVAEDLRAQRAKMED
jgi:Protein of unknown function (DUF2750)